MTKRAQGSVAHCPYCEASLPRVAAECPECRFPLTMAAADFGFRAPDHSGTTSTATPGGRPAALAPGHHPGIDRARVHGSRGHRMRITAWLLGVTSILLLLAGVGALFTAASPDATGDRDAKTSLLTALGQATGAGQGAIVATLPAASTPSSPLEVGVDQAAGFWFGVSKSPSGRCFVLAARLSDGAALVPGTLSKDEPCTGAHVRSRFEEKLTQADRDGRP